MRILDRLRRSRRAARLLQQAEALLLDAEQRNAAPPDRATVAALAARALALLHEAQASGSSDRAHLDLRLAQALFLLRRPSEALAPARRAAQARPYDVDSRIVHGAVRLALDHLPQAGHEYDAVLEEFNGDPDATAGRRAVALARGALPVEEDLIDADLTAAADLLLLAWDAAAAVAARLQALRQSGAEPALLDLIAAAARRRSGAD